MTNEITVAEPDDPDENGTLKFPPYKQAVEDLLAMNPKPGMEITDKWLKRRFDMADLPDLATEQEHKKRQIHWLEQSRGFFDELLIEHNICVRRVPGGYKILHPKEQTDFAAEEYERRAKRQWRRSSNKLRCIDYSALTDEQRQRNIDAQVRHAEIKRRMLPSRLPSMAELMQLK